MAGRSQGFARFGSGTGTNNEISKVFTTLELGKRYRLTVRYKSTIMNEPPPPDSSLSVSVNGLKVVDIAGGGSTVDVVEFVSLSTCAVITIGGRSNSTPVTVGPTSLAPAPPPPGACAHLC